MSGITDLPAGGCSVNIFVADPLAVHHQLHGAGVPAHWLCGHHPGQSTCLPSSVVTQPPRLPQYNTLAHRRKYRSQIRRMRNNQHFIALVRIVCTAQLLLGLLKDMCVSAQVRAHAYHTRTE